MNLSRICLSLIFCICTLAASAQTTRIRGRVTDAKTGEPMPLVSITIPGTTIGTTTDFEGIYTLETRQPITELVALYLSYERQSAEVKPRAFNEINFSLVPVTTALETVVVVRGKDPAYEVLRKVSKNKYRNNPDEKEFYTYSTYTKMELALANMKSKFKNRKMQKNFGFVFDYMDTSAITGRAYLPVMISESSADYYYRRNPKLSREVVKASRISGIEEDYTLAQFTGHLHVNVNIYDNYINIFRVAFASPLSEHGSLFYDYYLVDSTNLNGRKTYKIRFHPKGKGNPVFDGEVNIDSLTWALESATMRMPKGLNINWIRELVIENTNQLVNDSTWFLKQDKIMADFSIEMRDSAKMVSFMGRRQIDYSDIKLEGTIPHEIARLNNDVVMSDTVLHNDESFWHDLRPYELSKREKNIFVMVDSIKKAPLYRNIYDLINTALFGYYKIGKVELGPYYKLFSFNRLEGGRFQLGARTTRDFSKKIRLSGYGAYSTKDKEFKGSGSVEYMFRNQPTSKLTVNAKHDVQQLGASENAFTTGNILSSILSRGNNYKLTMINQYGIKFEKEWLHGFTNTFAFDYKDMFHTKYVDFKKPDGTTIRHIPTAELKLSTRISKDEVIVRKTFENLYVSSKFPVLKVDLTAGVKNLFKSHYEYYRTELALHYNFPISPLGRSDMILSGGKVFGRVPYPLLKLHEGNATYFYDPLAFSCMNFYEFASDLWTAVFWEHHFQGFFLSKIPLLKRLKWREVLTAKFLWGSLSDKNNGGLEDTKATLLFPEGMSRVSKPYVEVGFGIENIFRIIRIDAVWRLTHRNGSPGQKVDNFAINFALHLNF